MENAKTDLKTIFLIKHLSLWRQIRFMTLSGHLKTEASTQETEWADRLEGSIALPLELKVY